MRARFPPAPPCGKSCGRTRPSVNTAPEKSSCARTITEPRPSWCWRVRSRCCCAPTSIPSSWAGRQASKRTSSSASRNYGTTTPSPEAGAGNPRGRATTSRARSTRSAVPFICRTFPRLSRVLKPPS